MRLPWSRPRGADLPLALARPRPDGAGWPDAADVGRPSFEASALYELALRNAYEIEAHAVADRLVDQLLPRLSTGATAVDEPFFRKVVLTAARVGAGIGMTDRSGPVAGRDAAGGPETGPGEAEGPAPASLTVGRPLAGALLLARQALPGMPPVQAALAGYFLLAGFHVARTGPDEVDRLDAELA